jgi:subfamily B ATP-binding cassette protein HlyB/CyaB
VGAENQSFLIETITGIQTVKTMAVEQQFIQKYEAILARYVKAAFATVNLANVAGNIGMFLQQAFNVTVLWVGAHAVMNAKMSVGELIAFQMLSGQVLAPILRLVNMWQYFQQTRVSIERLGDIMNDKAEPAFNANRTTLPSIDGDIVFDRVTFRYRQDSSEVLRQISLRIQPGMRVGIVGRSGSGKSTLTKLIQRLYVPDSGRVLIDGVDLAQVEPAWLRRQIGVVLQENFLFSGSIRENITTAKPNATEEEVIRVAQLSGAEEFIAKMPRGYDNFVGERGSLLSGGQRQRISIARALLLDPRILIFDEATSALDYESERIILDQLDQMVSGRTMIMIAHRLSTVRNCDNIIVMEQGRIVEQGTHDELMRQQSHYYHLYNQQEEQAEESGRETDC